MAFSGHDFEQWSSLDKLNLFKIDRNLQFLIKHVVGNEEYENYVDMFDLVGEISGSSIMERGSENDKLGVTLGKVKKGDAEYTGVILPKGMKETLQEITEAGLVGVTIAEQFKEEGVPSLSDVYDIAFGYMISSADGAGYLTPMLTGGVADVIENFADEEMKKEYIPPMVSTDSEKAWTGAMLLTEPDAGSDLGALRTTAKHVEGKHYKLNGTKLFITNPDADVCLTLAKIEGSNRGGTKDISTFVMPKFRKDGTRNSWEISRVEEKLGIHASATGELSLEDADAYLVGDPGEGFKYMLRMMNKSRLKVSAQSAGIMQRSLVEALKYTATRKQFGVPIIKFPLVKDLLTQMTVDLEAAQLMMVYAAHYLALFKKTNDPEDFKLARIMTPMAKYWNSEVGIKTTSQGIQCFGGYGFVTEYAAERCYRDIRICALYEGTSEIQVQDVLRSATKEGTFPAFLKNIDETLTKVTSNEVKPYVEKAKNELELCKKALDFATKHEDRNYINYKSKKLVEWLIQIFCLAHFCEEADYQIKNDNNARKILVIRQFLNMYFDKREDRGLTDPELDALNYFDNIVGYKDLPPNELK